MKTPTGWRPSGARRCQLHHHRRAQRVIEMIDRYSGGLEQEVLLLP
jgi:hypothetical protein